MNMPNRQNYFYMFAVLTIVWCIIWIIENDVKNVNTIVLIVIFVFGIGVNVFAAISAYHAAIRRYLKDKD